MPASGGPTCPRAPGIPGTTWQLRTRTGAPPRRHGEDLRPASDAARLAWIRRTVGSRSQVTSKISAAAVQPEEVSAPGRSGRAMVYMLTSRKPPWADYRAGTRAEPIIVWGTIENSGRNSGSLDRICRPDRDHPERLGAEGARARLSDRRAGARTPPLHRPIRTSLAQASLAQVPAEVVVSVFCSCLAASRCPWNAGPTFSTKALSSAFLIAGSSVVFTASSTCW